MRILVATHHRGVVGGAETHLRAVMPLLRTRGHELGLLVEDATASEGGRIDEEVPDTPCWIASQREAAHVLTAIQNWQPDVAYQHGLMNADLEGALLERFPSVLFAHTYRGTCISGSKQHTFPTPRPCHRAFGPACLAYYLPRRCGGRNPKTMLSRYRLQVLWFRLLRSHQRVLVASHHMFEEYVRHGLSPPKLVLAPYFPTGVSPDPLPPSARSMTGRVLMMSRLTKLKGGHLLVSAIAVASKRLGRQLELVLAGNGPEINRLLALGVRMRVPMRYLGWVESARRETVLRQADILAMPSTWPEPFGLVGIEAGCVGLPAVAYAAGGVPDWLRPGISGESAPADPPTVEGLAAAIVRSLSRSEHLAKLRDGAWRVAQTFGPEAHLAVLERSLNEAAARAFPPSGFN